MKKAQFTPSWSIDPYTRQSASTSEQPNGHRLATGHRDVAEGSLDLIHHTRSRVRRIPTLSVCMSSSLKPLPLFSVLGLHRKWSFPRSMARTLGCGRIVVSSISRCLELVKRSNLDSPNFTGPAATWLQTLELHGRVSSWEQLHTEVCKHFDRDQYQLHIVTT